MRAWLPVIASLLLAVPASGQQFRASGPFENPVFVDDSPVAYELFRRAQDQSRDNVGEAARLCQELLDEYALRLIPASEAAHDHFTTVRSRVLRLLRSDRFLLERHRTMETPEAQRLLDAGDLDRLALTRPLTPPGLEAYMRLAQAALEAGRFETALGRLDAALAHPDLDPHRAAHAWHMRGMAGRYLGDSVRLFEALDALAVIAERETATEARGAANEAAALREHLDRLAGRDLPVPVVAASPMDRADVFGLTELVPERIWEIPLPDSLYARATSDVPERQHPWARPRQPGVEGGLMPTAPTIAGDVVYINQGHAVSAHDRFTGSPLWPQPYVEQPTVRVLDRLDEQAMDLNIVAVSSGGERVVTLTGHAYTAGRSSEGRLVCLDAHTGAMLWSRRLDRLDGAEEMEGLFPHGAPIVAEGAVYVLARKISPQSLTSTYLVSLDLDSGATKWTRHMVSSASQLRAPRAFSTLVYEGGDLYVADGVGAIARIDASTGQTHWLTRFSVPINPTQQERVRRPWEVMAPAIVASFGGDRVVSLQPGLRRVLVLDRETGEMLESRDAAAREGWNSPAYLLAGGPYIFAVGRELRAFHIENLETPVWRLESQSPFNVPPPDEAPQGRRGRGPEGAPVIRGRVQLVEGALIVPTDDGVLIVDDQTGAVLHRLEIEPGNPVALESQLVIAGVDRLDAYMSLARAEAMLRERIAAFPGDPEPALALLRLASRAPVGGNAAAGNLPLALDAADHAWSAIRAGGTSEPMRLAQRELFTVLLDLHEQGATANAGAEQAELLYAALDRIAQGTEQRLAQRIAHGDFLSVSDPHRAAGIYHGILADRDLVSLQREENGIIRPAAAWVTQRLGALIGRNGKDLYAGLAGQAESRLKDLLRQEDADPLEFMALAETHPFAPASLDAALQASARLLAHGEAPQAREALGAVMRLYRGTPRNGRLAREQADRLLSAAAAAREAAGWLSRAGTHVESNERRPVIGPQRGEAEVLRGWLVRQHRFATQRASRPDRALVMDRTQLNLLHAPELRVAWTVDLNAVAAGAGLPEMLDADEESIVLWYGGDPEDPRAVVLDAADGSRRWVMPRLSDHVGTPLSVLGRIREVREQMPSGEPFDPRGWIPLVETHTLVVASRTGSVAGFDLPPATGAKRGFSGRSDGPPLWTRQDTLDQVHLAAMRDGLVVLAGAQRQAAPRGRAILVPAIVVLDARTGEPIHHRRAIQPAALDGGPSGAPAGITWMRLAPAEVGGGGLLVCASRGGLQVIDLFTGECLGANVTEAAAGARQGVLVGETLIFEDARGMLRSMDLASLAVSPPFEPPPSGDLTASPLHLSRYPAESAADSAGILAHSLTRVVRYDTDGSIRGVDIVRDERSYRWVMQGDGRFVVVSATAGRRGLPHVYRLYLLSTSCRLLDEAVQLPAMPELQEAALVDGWLLLSAQGGTLAVPMPAD